MYFVYNPRCDTSALTINGMGVGRVCSTRFTLPIQSNEIMKSSDPACPVLFSFWVTGWLQKHKQKDKKPNNTKRVTSPIRTASSFRIPLVRIQAADHNITNSLSTLLFLFFSWNLGDKLCFYSISFGKEGEVRLALRDWSSCWKFPGGDCSWLAPCVWRLVAVDPVRTRHYRSGFNMK